MQSKKMVLLLIIVLSWSILVWIYAWSRHTAPVKMIPQIWTWAKDTGPNISYQDASWIQVFTDEDTFLRWFVSTGKSYNDITVGIHFNGLNVAYILYIDFLSSIQSPEQFKSFFERNWFMQTMILLYREKNLGGITTIVTRVFDVLYQRGWDAFVASQNKVLWTVGLRWDDLKKQTIVMLTKRAHELFLNGFLTTDFESAWMHDPIEVAVQNWSIDTLKGLCAKGAANNEYPIAYCMDFVYLYRSSRDTPYTHEVKNIFMKNLAESYNKYGLKKVWK